MLNNIQALRALAALFVVATHISAINAETLARWLAFGNYGVDIFFVISGFVMVLTTTAKPSTPARFMGNRIARIVPLYWLFTFAVFFAALVLPSMMQSTVPDWGDLLKSLFFVPYLKGDAVQPMLFLGWTLNYEMFFYALFAVSLLIRGSKKRVAIVSTVLAALVLAGLLVRPTEPVLAFYTDPIILEFAIGMWLGIAFPRMGPARIAAAIGGLGFVALILAGIYPFGMHRLFVAGIPAAAIVYAALALEKGGRAVADPRLLLLGAASYALYLSHPFVLIPAQIAVRGAEGWALIPIVAGCFAATILVAVAVHLWVERRLKIAPAVKLRHVAICP